MGGRERGFGIWQGIGGWTGREDWVGGLEGERWREKDGWEGEVEGGEGGLVGGPGFQSFLSESQITIGLIKNSLTYLDPEQ